MLNDVPFEAAFLRAAVLVGLVHERDVPDWAATLLRVRSPWTARLADVAAERVELSAIREALRTLSAPADPGRVASAILTAASLAQRLHPRNAVDLVTMLGQIRQEFRRHLPEAAASRIKAFENRLMFAHADVPGQTIPEVGEVAAALDELQAPGHFRYFFGDVEERAAFVAALSRKIARDRGTREREQTRPIAHAWLMRDPAGDADAVVLDLAAMSIAAHAFAPVPPASRIPYAPSTTADATLLFDGATAAPLGADDVRARLS